MKLIPSISHEQISWRNDDSIWPWCRQNHIVTYGQQGDWFKRIEIDPSIQMFGIETDSSIVGTCGLTSINYHHGTAEFSLLIGPKYQGNGYGKKGLILLLDYGFNRLRLETIWGEVMEGNPAHKVFAKMGFNNCGTLRARYFKGRTRLDVHAIDITREEFNERYTRSQIEEIKGHG